MTKSRLLALPLTMALAVAGMTTAVAQDADPVDPMAMSTLAAAQANGLNMVEAYVLYNELGALMTAAGVATEDVPAAVGELGGWFAALAQEDLENLAEYSGNSEALSQLYDEIGAAGLLVGEAE